MNGTSTESTRREFIAYEHYIGRHHIPTVDDPGSEPDAPYRNEHLAAMEVEKFIADHANKKP